MALCRVAIPARVLWQFSVAAGVFGDSPEGGTWAAVCHSEEFPQLVVLGALQVMSLALQSFWLQAILRGVCCRPAGSEETDAGGRTKGG
jgi:hypothetical protein